MKGNESYCGDKRRECWTERERDQSREGNMKGRDWRGKPDMKEILPSPSWPPSSERSESCFPLGNPRFFDL